MAACRSKPTRGFYRDSQRILEQARAIRRARAEHDREDSRHGLGIPAIEEATAAGHQHQRDVSFTLPQAVAVAEAVERGLSRRESAGLPIATMGPVCTSWSGGWMTG